MEESQIVHKIVFFDPEVQMCVVMGKFVSGEEFDKMEFFMGIVTRRHPEDVTLDDIRQLTNPGRGIPITKDTFSLFFDKDDYNEHDLLDGSEESLSIQLKD